MIDMAGFGLAIAICFVIAAILGAKFGARATDQFLHRRAWRLVSKDGIAVPRASNALPIDPTKK